MECSFCEMSAVFIRSADDSREQAIPISATEIMQLRYGLDLVSLSSLKLLAPWWRMTDSVISLPLPFSAAESIMSPPEKSIGSNTTDIVSGSAAHTKSRRFRPSPNIWSVGLLPENSSRRRIPKLKTSPSFATKLPIPYSAI
ncbi:unnamed protein product [Linum tenue]|uniref:Uncharacterized protein n=1 Tax=Linum tenue TaxID=586396 RepID=A0AAV0J4N0_9ROSI|nr:unnamed protein product [Linum tenue]